ncbi:NAD(P)/FAD-dependent oxidoreductase [Glycomyces sp. NPDC046736]|uniref:NAD(P)/FAD-dependent oxidoreductase n=1 Tax=Glycomyces sp. NPDC046736 TaxID=3155615 RepID=UPI0033D8ED15
MADDHDYDIIIAGAGAAGLSAALMLGRSKSRVLVISQKRRRNSTAAKVNNVPFAHGESPEAVYTKMERDAAEAGAQFVWDTIDAVSADDDRVTVETVHNGVYTARRLLLATGRVDRLPSWLPSGIWGRTAFDCPYCHTFENDGKDFAVIGNEGPNAVVMARLAQAYARSMTVIVQSPEAVKAHPRAADLLQADGARIVIDEVERADVLESGRLRLRTRGDVLHEADVLLLTEVPQPDHRFTAQLGLELNQAGYPATDLNGRTSHPRVYSAGNALGSAYYMWTGAAASGLNAARAIWEDKVLK